MVPVERVTFHLLLCPTHHRMIDNNPEEWTVEKLKQLKEEHENWVTIQLDQGRIIYPPSIDNSSFLACRKKEWYDFAEDYVWVISSITPLEVSGDTSGDTIDTCDSTLWEVLNNLELPRDISGSSVVNPSHTRTNYYGVINEDLRYIPEGIGHRVQIFRNGHCEFLISLEESTRHITKSASAKHPEELGSMRALRYTDIAECFIRELQGLKDIWNTALPFNDMLITVAITNTNSTRLIPKETKWPPPVFGFPVNSKTLEYSCVINKKADPKSLSEQVIKRFVNYYGLVVDTVFDENGDLIPPTLLHYRR